MKPNCFLISDQGGAALPEGSFSSAFRSSKFLLGSKDAAEFFQVKLAIEPMTRAGDVPD